MKRGSRIHTAHYAIERVQNDQPIFYEKNCISPMQLRTWPLGKLLRAVRDGKLYQAREEQFSDCV